MQDKTLTACKCGKTFQFILKHITPGACKKKYTKQEIHQLKQTARRTTIIKNNDKRKANYNKAKRRQRYINEKTTTKQGKHNVNPFKSTQKTSYNLIQHFDKKPQTIDAPPKHNINPLKMTHKNSYNLLEYAMLKGFERMESLVNKEIKRNNSSLLPPLQQK